MNNVLSAMMDKYSVPTSDVDAKNIVKQALQEIALCGLGRSDFFTKASFNGGTALRIFHNLSRFSEDLDFSIDGNKAELFKLSDYVVCINDELASLGIPATFEIDSESGVVKRGYIKGDCKDILTCFGIEQQLIEKTASNEVLRIKLEADATILQAAKCETKYLLQPYPTPVRLYDGGTLFAGKLAVVLSRSWKSRVKGRDLYDYIFYINKNYPLNISHLESRLKSKEYINCDAILNIERLKELLINKFQVIDYTSAKADVAPFIADRKALDFWSSELFVAITNNHQFLEEE